MKQLQFGLVEDELIERFNKVLMAMIIKSGRPMTRINAFKLMIKDAEEKYLEAI